VAIAAGHQHCEITLKPRPAFSAQAAKVFTGTPDFETRSEKLIDWWGWYVVRDSVC
jgi:hypothetical protein